MYNCGEKWEIVGNHKNNMIGNYKNKIDDKGRMTIPSKFRNELGEAVVISFGFDNTLEIRTKLAFDDWMNSLKIKGNLNANARKLQRIILGNSFDLSIDKAGRINLPASLIELAKIDKEVAIVGIGDKIEVHSAEQWDALTNPDDDLSATMEELAAALEGE